MSEFDKRQLKKMQQVIKDFKGNVITLSSFISNMEFLFHALENVDDNWDESFLEEIAGLESVNSGLPETVSAHTGEEIVSEAISNIDKLVNERL